MPWSTSTPAAASQFRHYPNGRPVTITTEQLREQLKTTPYGYIYDGIRIFELGEDAELVVTIGHVDRAAFAKAYDAYLDEVCGEQLRDLFGQRFTVEEFVAEA